MPRIHPVRQPDDEQRQALTKTLHNPDGTPVNVFATLVHQPQLMRRINALGGYFMAHGSIEIRERELAILRVAAFCHCPYEIGQHRWISQRTTLTVDEVDAALDSDRLHSWSYADANLLRFVDELLTSGTITDSTWELLESWGDVGRTELVVLVGFYRMLAGVLNSLEIELDPSVAEVLNGQRAASDG